MKTKLFRLLIVVVIITASHAVAGEAKLPHVSSEHLFNPNAIPSTCIIRDSSNIYWTVFTSDFLGFHEFWVAYSKDALNWSRALYTGVPVLPSDNYQIMVKKHHLDFDWRGDLKKQNIRHYYRAIIDTTIMGYTVFKSTLYEDSDGDGLSNLLEDRIWTDAYANDTDGDDKADGFDQNPLAGPVKELTIQQKLHKRIIEFELDEFESNQLVIVEQFDGKPMEYERPAGLVLSMSTGAADAFVEFTGFGVPILTCTVKDTTNDMLKASFQFFAAPDDAWGYDLVCRWSRRKKDWTDYNVFNEWVAD